METNFTGGGGQEVITAPKENTSGINSKGKGKFG